jgi:hypothetical protein
VFNFAAQSMARFAVDVYVMDTSSWGNGTYEGYSYATDWAGNTTVTGPSATFDVDVKRLESGTFSATFNSAGPGQFEMSAAGRIVDAAGNGVAGESLELYARRARTSIAGTTTYTYHYDNTQTTDLMGYFNFTAPASSLLFENPVPAVHTTDGFRFSVRDSSIQSKWYGYIDGVLDNPPLQLTPTQLPSTQKSLISNLSTSLDLYLTGPPTDYYRITVSGNMIRVDGSPVASGPVRFLTSSYDIIAGSHQFSSFFDVNTDADGAFSSQIPTDIPAGPWNFRVYIYDDNLDTMGSLYQLSPTPGTIQSDLY